MNKKTLIPLSILGAAALANYLAFAVFNEPTEPPPGGNTPAPINVGSDYQRKAGNLEVDGFTANNITLGGVTRSTWPNGAGGPACSWEGTKCDCKDDQTSTWTGSTISSKITVGSTCLGGVLTNVKVVNFQVSTGERRCQKEPPAECTPGLYTRN